MSRCKDCFHKDACLSVTRAAFPTISNSEIKHASDSENDCKYFKPAANVVDVVRCKDCKECDHCYPSKDKGGEAIEGYYCYHHNRWVSAGYYCGDGARRDEV